MFVADTITSSQPVKGGLQQGFWSRNLHVRIYYSYILSSSEIKLPWLRCIAESCHSDWTLRRLWFVSYTPLHTCAVVGLNIWDDRHSVFLHPAVSELVLWCWSTWFQSKDLSQSFNKVNVLVGIIAAIAVWSFVIFVRLFLVGRCCELEQINRCLLVTFHKST